MWVRGAGAGPLAWLLPQARCGHELQRAPAGGAGLTAAPAQAPGWGGAAHLPGSALPVRSWEKLAACAPRSPGSPKQPADLAGLFPAVGRAGAEGPPPGLSPNTQRLARRPLRPCPGFGGVPGPAWLLRLCLRVPPSRPAPQGRPQESGSPGARALRSPGRKRGQLNPEDRADKGAPGPALSHPVHNSPGNKQEAVCFHLSSKNTRISSRCSGLPPKAPLNPRGAGREGGPGLGRVLPWAAPHRVPGQAGSARPLQSLSEPTAGSWQGSQGS